MLPAKRPGRPAGFCDRGAGNGAGRAGGPIGGDGARSGRDPAPAAFRRLEQRHGCSGSWWGVTTIWASRVPFGAHLRYLVYASEPAATVVACVQFSSAAWRIAVRDRWIGWEFGDAGAPAGARGLEQSLFSVALGPRSRTWRAGSYRRAVRHAGGGLAPELRGRECFWLETLVDPGRYRGSCYRGANWIERGAPGAGSGRIG